MRKSLGPFAAGLASPVPDSSSAPASLIAPAPQPIGVRSRRSQAWAAQSLRVSLFSRSSGERFRRAYWETPVTRHLFLCIENEE